MSGNASPTGLVQHLTNRLLHLIVMPTEQCNFRCVYCYEDFALGRMKPETVRGLKALMRQRGKDLDALSLGWFGGEPLLAYDIVEDVQAFACDLQQRHPGMKVIGNMTTNASLLTPERFRRLVELEVTRYQITLDGPRHMHNRKRLSKSGEGTFDRVWRNLLAFRDEEREFEVVLRVHVDAENASAIPELLRECARAFGRDERFTLSIRGLRRLGGPHDATLPILDHSEELCLVDEYRNLSAEMGLKVHQSPFQGTAGPDRAQACYAAAANSFVVRSNGELSKCTVALGHPKNHVGWLNEDGSLQIENEKMMGWMRGLFSGDQQALKCPLLGYAT